MKNSVYISLAVFCLSGWISLSQAFAQYNTTYGVGVGTGGSYNTHIGRLAGKVSTGSSNTFLGTYSGYKNTVGGNNVFVGRSSGYNSTSGYRDTFVGWASGYSNTTGDENTFLGHSSGYRNTTGSHNTFVGYWSGYYNTTGNNNAFFGTNSGDNNTSGFFNTFIGNHSGDGNTTGFGNTYVGYYTGHNNETGKYNVFIGQYAGYNATGSNKLYIDNQSDSKPLIYGDFLKNSISIGTRYNGTTYKLFIPGKVRAKAYDVASDKRLKDDIQHLENAMTKLQKVEGVSYLLKDDEKVEQNITDNTNTRSRPAQRPVYYGFVAQDIQKVFPELVTEDEGLLAVNYMGMIPVLVEALKEITLERDSLKQNLSEVTQKNIQLDQRIAAIEKALELQKNIPAKVFEKQTGSILEQNHPNPFHESTTINYQVPREASKVSMVIMNQQGVAVQHIDNLQPGTGKVEISAGSLRAGTYFYSLQVDGKPTTTKRMILTP